MYYLVRFVVCWGLVVQPLSIFAMDLEDSSSGDITTFVKNHSIACIGALTVTSFLVIGGVLWHQKNQKKGQQSTTIPQVKRECIAIEPKVEYFTKPLLHEAVYHTIHWFVPLMKSREFNQVHFAACAGDVLVLRELLGDNPTIVHQRGPCNITPLMLAAGNGRSDAVKLLIEMGGLKPLSIYDSNHLTALCYAAFYGHISTTEILVDSIKKMYGVQALTDQSFMRSTPLHCAIQEKQYAIARLLLQKGLCAESTDRLGKTPLHLAVEERVSADLVAVLLKACEDCNKLTREGLTALDIAQGTTAHEIEQVLIDAGALTACELRKKAAQEKLEALYIRWLESEYGDINGIHDDGLTFLDKARKYGYKETEIVLLKYGAKTAWQVRECIHNY